MGFPSSGARCVPGSGSDSETLCSQRRGCPGPAPLPGPCSSSPGPAPLATGLCVTCLTRPDTADCLLRASTRARVGSGRSQCQSRVAGLALTLPIASSTHGLWALGWGLDSLLHLPPPKTPQVRRQHGVREPDPTRFSHGSAPPTPHPGQVLTRSCRPFERWEPCPRVSCGACGALGQQPLLMNQVLLSGRLRWAPGSAHRLSGLLGEMTDPGAGVGKGR